MPRGVAIALLALLCITALVPSSAADDDALPLGTEAAQVEAEATAGPADPEDAEEEAEAAEAEADSAEIEEVEAPATEAAADAAGVGPEVQAASHVPLTVRVRKTNDANGDGVFNKNDSVIVPFSGLVPFSVTITNTSSIPV